MKHIQHLEKIVELDSNTVCALVFVIQRSDCVIFQPTKGRNIVISFCGGFPKSALISPAPLFLKINWRLDKRKGGIFSYALNLREADAIPLVQTKNPSPILSIYIKGGMVLYSHFWRDLRKGWFKYFCFYVKKNG